MRQSVLVMTAMGTLMVPSCQVAKLENLELWKLSVRESSTNRGFEPTPIRSI